MVGPRRAWGVGAPAPVLGHRIVRVVFAVAPDAQQSLLQIAVGGQPPRLHDPVDPAIDHDRDVLGNLRGDADILFDDEDRFAFVAEPDEHLLQQRHDHRRQTFGRLVHDQEVRVEEERARDRQHLLFAARQLSAAIALAFGKPGEGVVDPARCSRRPCGRLQSGADVRRR